MIAGWLLAVGAGRHYAWPYFPDALQGVASKGLGAVAILVLLACVWRMSNRPRLLLPVLLWWAWEELQVVICSVAYMVEPWAVKPGQGICSARIGFDLGALGILIVSVLALHLIRSKRE